MPLVPDMALQRYCTTTVFEEPADTVTFFENPADLKINMPQLYDALCRVLNQDPNTTQKILKPEL